MNTEMPKSTPLTHAPPDHFLAESGNVEEVSGDSMSGYAPF